MKIKKIIITGANGLIGNYLLKKLITTNQVIAIDIDNSNILKDRNVVFYKVNLYEPKEINNFFSKLKKKKIKIDLIINCHGLTTNAAKRFKKNLFLKYLSINLTSNYYIFDNFIKNNNSKSLKKIISIGSIYGTISPKHKIYKYEKFNLHPGYTASKFGLVGLNNWFATKYADKNFCFNLISPGGIEANQSLSFKRKYKDNTPNKKFASLIEIYETVDFLMNLKNNQITGQNIHLDGGFTI
jgi:NAD(P)-dependent dehydrogenase (short-subunit alcohol dehydrogenase family)